MHGKLKEGTNAAQRHSFETGERIFHSGKSKGRNPESIVEMIFIFIFYFCRNSLGSYITDIYSSYMGYIEVIQAILVQVMIGQTSLFCKQLWRDTL